LKYGLSERTLKTLDSIFKMYPGIKEVILYGSRAKGNYRPGSDIDITLKTTSIFCWNDLLRISSDFEDSSLPYFVDVSIYDTLRNSDLTDHIDRVGKVLYP